MYQYLSNIYNNKEYNSVPCLNHILWIAAGFSTLLQFYYKVISDFVGVFIMNNEISFPNKLIIFVSKSETYYG